MSAIQQLDYVERYFREQLRVYKQLNALEDVYFAILNPRGIRKKDDFVIFDGAAEKARKREEYNKNKGLDKNKDGKVSVGEIAVTIRKMYKKGISPGYLG